MILERLKAGEGFTHQEKAVADYILDQIETIQSMSAEELARASYTSKATVVRLCKKVGVARYQDLKPVFRRSTRKVPTFSFSYLIPLFP